jgi:hypothetical protein
MLAADAQAFPAGRENAKVRAVRQQSIHEPSDGLNEVLTVVQNKEEVLRLQEVQKGIRKRADLLFSDRQGESDGLRYEEGVGDGSEFHEPDAVAELVQEVCADLKGEAGFADAAGTDKRNEARGPQKALRLLNFAGATHKIRALDGKIVQKGGERANGREVGRQVRVNDLADGLGTDEVAEAVLAEVSQSDAFGKIVTHEFGRRRRYKNLPSVGGRHEAMAPIERRAKEVALSFPGFSRVDGHPDADGTGLMPGLPVEGALSANRGRNGVRGALKDREERISGLLEDSSARRKTRSRRAESRRDARERSAFAKASSPRAACSPQYP